MDTVKGARILCLSTRYVGCVKAPVGAAFSFGGLCLSTRYVGCVLSRLEQPSNTWALPQHTLRRLRRQKYIKYFALFCRMCCKLVDSFSVEQRMLTALTIFPDFSAAKATYVAIIDSLGRTIDRFLWCEHPVFFLLTSTSPDAHTGRCLWHLA